MKDLKMSGAVPRTDFAGVRYQPQTAPVGESENVVSARTPSPRAELWLNVGRTCNVCLGNLAVGLAVALIGVSLLDLAEIYDTTLSAVSQLITTRCVGGLCGSLAGGKLYDTFNTQVLSILSMALACFTVLMIPLSGSLPLAHVMMFFCGFSQCAFGTGATVWTLKMWPKNSSPALQAFYFALGTGSLAAPFIAGPFLSTQGTANSRNALMLMHNTEPNSTDDLNATLFDDGGPSDSTIYYAFGIASAFQLAVVVSMTTLYFINNTSFNMRRTNAGSGVARSAQESAEYIRFARIIVALLSAYICLYVAFECTMSQMLTAFSVKCDLHFSKPLAARLVALHFLCFAASGLGAVLVTARVSTFSVLVASHVLLVTTACVLLVWGSSSAAALWACSALTGIAEGPLKAAMTAWIAKHINLSNKMMSIALVAGGLGSLSPPVLVGQFLDSTPNIFLYVWFTAVILSVIIFCGMFLYLRRKPLLCVNKQLMANVNSDNSDQSTSV